MSRPQVLLPLQLPSGRTIPNPLTKVALYEHLTVFRGGPPNEYHFALYSEWARNNWGIIMTGNIQVASDHLTFGRDLILPADLSAESLAPWRRLATITHDASPQSLLIGQLSHAGRQSLNFFGGRPLSQPPLGPSPVRVGNNVKNPGAFSQTFHKLLFFEPREMTEDDIQCTIERFVFGARVLHESGFDGVELHAAHGYLLAQFISPKSNHRSDQWSLQHEDGLALLHEIVRRIRAIVPSTFVVGIKVNAADYASSPSPDEGTPGHRALNHITAIAQWGGVDFIEVSGGDYEDPGFIDRIEHVSSQRQAFFSEMSRKAVEALSKLHRTDIPLPKIMLTGGLRTPHLIHSVLASGHADLIGIGRAAVLCPSIPKILETMAVDFTDDPNVNRLWPNTPFAAEPKFARPALFHVSIFKDIWDWVPKVTLIGAGVNVSWYEVSMRYLAEKVLQSRDGTLSSSLGPYPDYSVGGFGGLVYMWLWTASKATTHRSSRKATLRASHLNWMVIAIMAGGICCSLLLRAIYI